MNSQEITAFVTIAETLSFSKAAEKLIISQPALSKQIINLEKELGYELFHRNKREVRLTEKEKSALKYAKQIIRASQALESIGRNSNINVGLGQIAPSIEGAGLLFAV